MLRNDIVQATPYFMFYVLRALDHTGYYQYAPDQMRRWKSMLDRGATTWLEEWENKRSWCHAWSSAPTYELSTRVLGVRAAAVLMSSIDADATTRALDELQWMGVLRSLSAMQMYQRAVRGPIDGDAVVRFLLEHDTFPRAVKALLREVRRALLELPDPAELVDGVDRVDSTIRDAVADGVDGAELDDAMERLQEAVADLDRRIHDRYLRLG